MRLNVLFEEENEGCNNEDSVPDNNEDSVPDNNEDSVAAIASS